MKASNKKFQAFVDEVHETLPDGFEASIGTEGLTIGATAYAFIAFMRGDSAENCARDFVAKLGIEDKNEPDMDDTTIGDWEDQGGAI